MDQDVPSRDAGELWIYKETGLCYLKTEQECEEGGKSPVDPLPVSGPKMPQMEMYPTVEAAISGNETRVSGMKKELKIIPYVSFHSNAPGQLSPDTESESYIAETRRPKMTQMVSTREVNRGTYIECNTTSGLEIASSSSQSVLTKAMGISTQTCSPSLLQNLHYQTLFAMASCFTATAGYLLERQGKEQVPGARQRQGEEQITGGKQSHEEKQAAGVRQKTHHSQGGSERSVGTEVTLPEREVQKSASLRHSYEGSVKESKGKAIECSTCKKHFPSKFLFDKHIRVHRNERASKCSYFVKLFHRSCDLTRHMHIHSGEKPFQCSLCEKSFNQKGNLTLRMHLHKGERPYICSQCKKTFSRRDYLKVHMHLHTVEKPFKCSLCEKSFRQRTHLIKHMHIHSGEKPFPCSQCGKSFNKQGNLFRHMHIHK